MIRLFILTLKTVVLYKPKLQQHRRIHLRGRQLKNQLMWTNNQKPCANGYNLTCSLYSLQVLMRIHDNAFICQHHPQDQAHRTPAYFSVELLKKSSFNFLNAHRWANYQNLPGDKSQSSQAPTTLPDYSTLHEGCCKTSSSAQHHIHQVKYTFSKLKKADDVSGKLRQVNSLRKFPKS